MIKSKTKYEATLEEIKELFAFHKLGNVSDIAPLGNGEFNSAYKVMLDDGKSFALKIAPPEGATVLSYEKNMMESEVFWYRMMHENTDILCPEVYVRYALAVCYLALIEEVEKYVRYEPDEPNYIRNANDAGEMYDMAFDIL